MDEADQNYCRRVLIDPQQLLSLSSPPPYSRRGSVLPDRLGNGAEDAGEGLLITLE